MARPKKEGMDYFPHDTDAANDEKVDILRSLYGNDGYAFYFIMLERIYRTKKFELKIAEVSDAETGQKLIRNDPEMILILSKKLLISPEKFEKILSTCFRQKIFSEEKYNEFGVITSEGIKKRSRPVSEKRRNMAKAHKNKPKVSDAETTPETTPETPPKTPQKPPKGEEKKGEKNKAIKLMPPSVDEVEKYCSERNNGIDPQGFIDHYEANGWMRGKNKIKSWKACIRTWENNRKDAPKSQQKSYQPPKMKTTQELFDNGTDK